MWFKRGSLVVVFLTLLTLVWAFDIQKRISSSFDALLPEGNSKESLLIYQKINRAQEVILADEPDDMEDLTQKISSLKGYQAIYPASEQISEFRDLYRFYLHDAPDFLPKGDEVYAKLLKLKEDLSEGFKFSLDKNDPLSLFAAKENFYSMPSVKGFDDVSVFRLDITPNEYEEYYDKLREIAPDAYLFSPFFYQVENTRIFKSQVKIILSLSAIILGLLYIYWLRKPSLFFFSCVTLFSSAAFAQLVAGMIWREISMISFAFSAAVSTISVDYMFHCYLHDMYGSKKGFSKPVFYGFITTFTAFLALGFVKFTLISQIALSASCALAFSYVCFAFVYPHLGFGDAKTKGMSVKSTNILSPLLICAVSILLISGSFFWTGFDTNIKSLDVKNENLQQKEKMILGNVGNQSAVLISSESVDELIDKAQTLKGAFVPISSLLSTKDFEARAAELGALDFAALRQDIAFYAQKAGFREGYFDNAYSDTMLNPPKPVYSDEFLNESFLKTAKIKEKFYAVGFYDKNSLALPQNDDVLAIDSMLLFQAELKSAAKELMIAGVFIVFLIVFVIAFCAKEKFLKAFSFVLAPLAVCSLIFVFTPMSVLHIFMLVIVMAISVDYGIYSVVLGGKRTNEAVFYSLLSTIAGFGVLAFSTISSLQAMGITALCAAFTIWFLIYFIKADDETDSAK
ncbi:MAG: hypothetical protein LBS73_03405 [Campylobacteraceae bacterium]|jgi:predicted exporter|nr:hypothetical protein [Campylobacteraceae bacterium]